MSAHGESGPSRRSTCYKTNSYLRGFLVFKKNDASETSTPHPNRPLGYVRLMVNTRLQRGVHFDQIVFLFRGK